MPADSLARVSAPALTATAPAIDPTFENVWDETRVARARARVDRSGGAARAARRAADHVLLRLRPDRAEPAPGQPRAAAHDAPPAARRPQAARPRRRIDRPRSATRGRRPSARSTPRRPSPSGSATCASQVERFLSFEGDNAARMVNNLDWTAPMSAIDFLRDIGKHYRVGTMLKKDAVSARLNSDEGISYTEFSYQILQGLDYRELYLPVRLRAADRRQRPVGQPDQRRRPHPPRRGRVACTRSARR